MAPAAPTSATDVPKCFTCAATGKPLYMPVVTTQGVAYSYVALLEMFRNASGLPICHKTKEAIAFLPDPCPALHHFMMEEYKSVMKARKQEDETKIREKYDLLMPPLADAPDLKYEDALLEELDCVVTGELAYNPCVLSSGSIVSAHCIREGGFEKDPSRLIACALHGQAPRICDALVQLIQMKFPALYLEREQELRSKGVDLSGKFAVGSCAPLEQEDHIFWGLGCDGCGMWPIRGKAWEDAQCRMKAGFHLCDKCHSFGYHKRVATGRFSQDHVPNHTMLPMSQLDFF